MMMGELSQGPTIGMRKLNGLGAGLISWICVEVRGNDAKMFVTQMESCVTSEYSE